MTRLPATLHATNAELDYTNLARPPRASGDASSIGELPIEVLGRIIDHSITQLMSTESMNQLTTLRLVCRAWSDASLVPHRVWSSLEIKVPFTHRVRGMVERWFARSGEGAPRSIAVHTPFHEDCWDEEACPMNNNVLAEFLVSGPTLDHVSLSFRADVCGQVLMGRVQGQLALVDKEASPWWNLRSLRFVFTHEWDPYEDPDVDPARSLQRLPPVSTFHLHLPAYRRGRPDAETRVTIPPGFLNHLTTFTFDFDWNSSTLLRLLRECHRVETLTVHHKATGSRHGNPQEPTVSLPNLRILRLRQATCSSVSAVLPIRAPSLHELDLSFDAYGFLMNPSMQDYFRLTLSLDRFIATSGCAGTLQIFRLHALDISQIPVAIFSGMRGLEYLVLDRVRVPDDFVEGLASGTETALPNLKRLDIRRQGATTTASNHVYALMLQPRGTSGGPRLLLARSVADDHVHAEESDDWDWDSGPEEDDWDGYTPSPNDRVRDIIQHTLENDYL